jgi:hypothetical protein
VAVHHVAPITPATAALFSFDLKRFFSSDAVLRGLHAHALSTCRAAATPRTPLASSSGTGCCIIYHSQQPQQWMRMAVLCALPGKKGVHKQRLELCFKSFSHRKAQYLLTMSSKGSKAPVNKYLNYVRPFQPILPEIEKPKQKKLELKERLLWSLVVLFIYLVCCQVRCAAAAAAAAAFHAFFVHSFYFLLFLFFFVLLILTYLFLLFFYFADSCVWLAYSRQE